MIDVKDKLNKGERVRMSIEQTKITSIKPGLPIHAIFNYKKSLNMYFSKFMVMVAMETADN